VLADIQAFVQRRQEEDERRKNDIEELEEEMERSVMEQSVFAQQNDSIW